MNPNGWLITVLLCAAAFLPALGARTSAARRRLLVVGTAVALVVGSLAVASATSSGEGFFPSGAGWAFLLLGLPLGVGVAAAGLTLVLTRPTRLSNTVRTVLAIMALVLGPAFLIWQLL